jgi:hypothetical protein
MLNVAIHPLRELRNPETVDNCGPQDEGSCDASSRWLCAQVGESADCERGCDEAKEVSACRSKKCSESSFAAGEYRKSDPAQQDVDHLAESAKRWPQHHSSQVCEQSLKCQRNRIERKEYKRSDSGQHTEGRGSNEVERPRLQERSSAHKLSQGCRFGVG